MEPQPLSREEAKALLDACPDTTAGIRDRAILVLLYRGGCRITATLHIMPTDIDWDRKTVAIHDDKGGKGRTIVLDDKTMEILNEWDLRRDSLELGYDEPFFCGVKKNTLGKQLKSTQFRLKIKDLGKKAGVAKRCHLHGLRHTAASELMEEGFDIATISAQLGHTHISTTSRYLHRLRPDLANEKLKERTW